MKLYIANHTCSLAAQIIAHEVGMQLDIVHVDVKKKLFAASNDYLTVNRFGYVPTLQFTSVSHCRRPPPLLNIWPTQNPNSISYRRQVLSSA
jgi:hypothetical protein